jgi:diguanylate cyclase
VPLAERSGLMRQLTGAVLDRALADQAALEAAVPGARLAVNVSARNLLGQRLVDDVAHRLAAHGVSAAALTLEVSEPSVATDTTVGEVFGQLADLGCCISVSEYGTGQSSLTALAHLPGIGEIKISPGLVTRLHESEPGRRLVRAITTAAHSLEVGVVAEGVESVEHARELRALGCDAFQGYHVSAPAPLEEVLAWVGSWSVEREGRLGLDPDSSYAGHP